jgi:uncharacterized membrane protein YhaH (DUF805 family)
MPATGSASLDKPLYGASFTQAIKRFFAKYAVFSGRASRSEYWWVALFLFLVGILIWVPGIAVGVATGTQSISPTTGQLTTTPGPAFGIFVALGILVYLATLVPGIALTVRRLHDANLSGLLFLLVLVPSFVGLIILVLTLLETNPLGARFDADAQPAAVAPAAPPA